MTDAAIIPAIRAASTRDELAAILDHYKGQWSDDLTAVMKARSAELGINKPAAKREWPATQDTEWLPTRNACPTCGGALR